jgi:hypothetical protein
VKFLDSKKSDKAKVEAEEVAKEEEVSFLLNEKVHNINGVSAVVTAVCGDNCYDIIYCKCKTKHRGIEGKNLVKYVYKPVKNSRKRVAEYDVVVAPLESSDEFFKAANIDSSAVLPVGTKRIRKQVRSK